MLTKLGSFAVVLVVGVCVWVVGNSEWGDTDVTWVFTIEDPCSARKFQ
jgi:hypothetical protein